MLAKGVPIYTFSIILVKQYLTTIFNLKKKSVHCAMFIGYFDKVEKPTKIEGLNAILNLLF